jgi:hypothetical protein
MNASNFTAYFIYNTKYRILICRQCKFVVHRDSLQRHLERRHGDRDWQIRNQLVVYARTLDLIPIKEMKLLQPDAEVIEGLDVLDGLNCTDCGYLCATQETMMQHCRRQHSWLKRVGPRWGTCHVQRLFTGGDSNKYFRVELRPRDNERLTLMDDLVHALIDSKDRMEREQEHQLTMVSRSHGKVDLTPWMQRTGWQRMFAGRDMQLLASFSHQPSQTEREFIILWESVGEMLQRCGEGIKDCVERNWTVTLFWLNSPKPQEPSSKPFRVAYHKSTLEKYAHTWARMICMCCRAFDMDDKVPS